MVGIPGKSKGCHTCRKRKIRCDLQKPDCGRCLQSGRVCEGYNRGAVFLNRTAQGWAKRNRLEEAQPRDPLHDGPYFLSDNGRGSSHTESPSRSPEEPPVAYEPLSYLSDTNVKRQIFQNIFLDSYLPKNPHQGPGLQGAWLFEAIRLNNPGQALEHSLHALSLTRVGRITGQYDLIKRGNAAYGVALRSLFIALESPKLAGKDETLAACLILSFYELFESTSESTSAHEGHMVGIERLVQYRGPSQTQSLLGKALMKNISYASMIRSLQYRKTSRLKSLIDKIEWWDLQGKLFAKGHTIGSLLEELDLYKTSGQHSLAASAQYLKRCVELNAELICWYDDLVIDSPSPIYWMNDQEGLPGEISFANLSLAHLMQDFWALRLVLTTTISIICSQAPEGVPITFRNMLKQLDTEHGKASQVELATKIMESMPYCMKDEHGASSAQKCLLSGRIALFALRRHSSEQLVKYETIFRDLSDKKGLRFAQDISRAEQTRWTPVISEKRS